MINEAIEAFLEAEGAEIMDDADGFAELEAGNGVDARTMIAEASVMIANASDRERGSP